MAEKIQFDKVIALDEITQFFQDAGKEGTLSASMNATIKAQKYLQKIHDDAFESGFLKGIESSKKIDEHDIN